jgi:phytoene synthase
VVTAAAYDTCLRLAARHYENFPVASRLLPRAARPHIAAVYAFARTADDFADEGDRPVAARLALLDDWSRRLHDAASGRVADDNPEVAAIFTALADTMRARDLEPELFDDLISAFRQDVTTTRYASWTDLLDYCRRSANPVGRLVLRIAGYRDSGLDHRSDAVCTALQLTNFWQDLERDLQKGRVYVPQDISRAAGADESDLLQGRFTEAWRAALRQAAGRTRELFWQGRPVADGVHGRLRLELRATWLGGMRILTRLEASGFDVFHTRPTLGWADALGIGWQTLLWTRRPAADRV